MSSSFSRTVRSNLASLHPYTRSSGRAVAEALNLEAAARFVGIPPDRLHAMAWAKIGPPSNGSYWFPTFDAEALSEWKASNATGRDIPKGREIGTKAVYRHRAR